MSKSDSDHPLWKILLIRRFQQLMLGNRESTRAGKEGNIIKSLLIFATTSCSKEKEGELPRKSRRDKDVCMSRKERAD